MPLVFVYGTLKRGGSNHAWMAGQQFVGEARTVPGFCLYALDGYPGLVVDPRDRDGVTGEVWSVQPAALAKLDEFEGTAEGLYTREPVKLLAPFADQTVDAYLYARSIAGRQKLGATWR